MKPLGYTFLNGYYTLLLPKLRIEVYQDAKVKQETLVNYGASKRKLIPGSRNHPDNPYDNMIAAIKYQGIRLHYFSAIFSKVDISEFTAFIAQKPHSKYNRVLWHLYEWLTQSKLDLPSLTTGSYIQLFEDEFYYTLAQGDRDQRTRVINNALGTHEFCPTIRKTPDVLECAKQNVYETAYSEMQKLGNAVNADVIGRSIQWLYKKETKSSTDIEREDTSNKKMSRFLHALTNAGQFNLEKNKLIDLQNKIVEESKKAHDYRTDEIYVGSTINRLGGVDEDVHFIGPLSKHVESMMNGLLQTNDRLMIDGAIPALMHATVISFGEVYIHPFDDGNGRIHRYLIHDILKQREPEHEFIIPISAAILKNEARYDEVLNVLTRPIMAMLDWQLDHENDNAVIISSDLDYMYRFPDFTEHVLFVYDMMNQAISRELVSEIALLIVFDRLKKLINQHADVPNNRLNSIVSIILSGGGVISKKKYKFVAQELSEDVIKKAESEAVNWVKQFNKLLEVDLQSLMNE